MTTRSWRVASEQPATVAVVGVGTMGAGIAQIAAQAGHVVRLFDVRDGAAVAAKKSITDTLDKLAAKGKLTADDARATGERLVVADALEALADAALVVEVIVEDAEIKRALFRQLEGLVADDAILATNTSSLSVTALARGLAHPERLVGMHFFNPVPLMRLVEVVQGALTDASAAEAVATVARRWGKTPIAARSTPGFVVNRIARPFYAESLFLLRDGFATPSQVDGALRAAGFKMGPCELMDLIGHDVNYAVTTQMHQAFSGDPRFVPSLVQKDLVDGGLLGRKSGRGFYVYEGGAKRDEPLASPVADATALPTAVTVAGRGPLADRLHSRLATAGIAVEHVNAEAHELHLTLPTGELWLTDGRPAAQIASERGVAEVAVFDLPLAEQGGALAVAFAHGASPEHEAAVTALLTSAGHHVVRVGDAPGLVVMRTIAMLINEAQDTVAQGTCTEQAADLAMKLGTNYPAGPFEWLHLLGAPRVTRVLAHLHALDGTGRYRTSPDLVRRLWRDARPAT